LKTWEGGVDLVEVLSEGLSGNDWLKGKSVLEVRQLNHASSEELLMKGWMWNRITVLLPTPFHPIHRKQGKNSSTRLQPPSPTTSHTPKPPPYCSTILDTRNGTRTGSFGYYGRNQTFVQIPPRETRGRARIQLWTLGRHGQGT
jgi:hypothetical protein